MYLDRQLIAGAVELLMRRVRGLGSWSALERESGVSRSTLYRLKDADPRVETSTFARIEHALQLPPDTLVTIGVHDTEGLFVPARDAAQLADPQPTPHDLRHSFGSWLAAGGVPPTNIMALMGHSSLRATERYLHAGDGRFAQAVMALIEQ